MMRPDTPGYLHVSDTEFRSLAERVTGIAADFLAGLDSARTYPQVSGMRTAEAFGTPVPESGVGAHVLDELARVLEMIRPPSPRFFGYVLGSGEPVGALADLLASVINQNVTAWRSSPAAVAMEQQVVRWIATALNCPQLTGSLCGGGSSANLMALAMAREAKLPANESGARPGVVYAASEVHMSIPKAVALLGLGRNNLRLLPADDRFQIDCTALEEAIVADTAAGRTPLAVVASAGTVNTGSIDPFEQVAAVCNQFNVWLHVDGAYGALAALAIPSAFRGLDQADSLSLDPHKWLYQPVDCGLLLFKDAAIARETFAHSGAYARSLESDPSEAFSFFEQSMELSRRFRALKLWLSLRYHGMAAFRSAIRADLDHAQLLAGYVQDCRELELLAPVPLSAVCFRYRERTGSEPDHVNAAILKRVIERGRIYLSNASIRGHFALRACFVNHRTTASDVAVIVPEVLAAARDLGVTP